MALTVDIFGSGYITDSFEHTSFLKEFSMFVPVSRYYEVKNTGAILLLWS